MTLPVVLPAGEVGVSTALSRPAGSEPWAAVALAHGAGAGMDHPFLAGFAGALADAGVAVLRFTFPYLEAGRRMPGPAAHAVATWGAALERLARDVPGVPRIAAGKSYGGRMASMAAAQGVIAPAGLVYVGYPFHPPGRPDEARAAHLPDVRPPQLFLAGTADPFLQPLDRFTDAVATCRDATIQWTEGGGHSFEVRGRRRPAADVAAELAASAVPWLRDVAQRPAA